MTASLALYRFGTRLLEPLAPWLVEQRLKKGKEHPDRIGERFGLTRINRPNAPLIWMHGASVGESRLLLDVFAALRKKRPDVYALVTTQTLTSADMIAASTPPNVIHQMAPVDGPKATETFLNHWRPDAAVFAEGEIWPNMLVGLRANKIPAALINARMTEKTLRSWRSRQASASEVFATFDFIGAADQATADGLHAATGRRIGIVGNLKTATHIEIPPAEKVAAFRRAVNGRPIVLAASTHPGEDEFALDAFTEVRIRKLGALLIIVPRHPVRGDDIVQLSISRGLTTQQWSKDKSPPGPQVDILVADTIGELLFWYAASDGVYLGGATAAGVGGHNAIEPTQLGKRVFTGPNGFNFRETFDALEQASALRIGATSQDLVDWWLAELDTAQPAPIIGAQVTAARQPFEATLAAIEAMLPKPPQMREPHFWRVTDKRSRAAAPMIKLLMTPLSLLYRIAGQRRIARATPVDVGIPVVCIGNLTLGGAGKTPVTAAVRAYYKSKGVHAASLSRGYGGNMEGAHRVDPGMHMAYEVGDEPLMLAATGESWISKHRPLGASRMKLDGVEVIVMDDGHQNPTLKKALSVVVIDASNPFGNGHIFPRGPLRERVADGLARADAVVLMGEGETPPALTGFKGTILRAGLQPLEKLPPGRYVAFAGIGRPERFFDALQRQDGVELAESVPFPDHHLFKPSDIAYLMKLSAERDARLVTTDKDHVRLPHDVKPKVLRASVEAKFEDVAALAALLDRVLK